MSRRIAWSLASFAIVATLVSSVLLVANHLPLLPGFRPHLIVVGTVYAAAGALIVARRPRNSVGWVLIAASLFWTASFAGEQYAWFGGVAHTGILPGAALAAWVESWVWLPGSVLIFCYLALLFPDGRLPSRRWLPTAALLGMLTVLGVIGIAGAAWPYRGDIRLLITGNFDMTTVGGVYGALANAAIVVFIGALVAAGSAILRFRRARDEERQQLRWFAFAVALAAVTVVVDPAVPPRLQGIPSLVGVLVLPIAVAVAVFKYRLYDLDIVIRKTVVFGVVASVLTALYLGVVAVATVGRISRLLVGVILLAITFNPVRKAARALADRLVYGRRASSYEVLTDFTERMSETYATDDVLPRMARVLANATGATSACVWLRVGGELRLAAEAGEPVDRTAIPIAGDATPEIPGAQVVGVRHQGELLGALSVTLPASDPLDPSRERLMGDLASQAGLVLRNARLIEELRASRQRLVAAQDEERRRIERNIHDGAQQQLVALAVQLKLLEQLAGNDPEKERELAAALGSQANSALDDLRDLARGIYPPLLADKGLTAALEAQVGRAAVPTTLEVDGVGRYSQEIEAAVYFCTLEALNNVAKYAEASRATISLAQIDGHLTFAVDDDGHGFDPSSTGNGTGLQGMADRLDAIGGTLHVRSAPGSGTTVWGRVPVGRLEVVA